jgi:hypothetical protein
LGCYLGPTEPDVGLVMTAKILTKTGEIIRRNTYRHLTPEELDSDANQKERELYDTVVNKCLGDPLKGKDLSVNFGV